MHKPNFDIEYYKKQRDYLKNMFKAKKTGDQNLLYKQTKLYQPLLTSQKEIQDKLDENQTLTSSALIPLLKNMTF